ncbi:MAG: hypothetical protein ACUVYA_14760 [Planctomycetota bacterium]
MATTGPGQEEIIEKRTTDPVALTCLVGACVALLGAIIFQVSEIAAYRAGGAPAVVKKGPGQDRADKFLRQLQDDIDNAIRASTPGAAGEKESGAGFESTEAESEESKAAEPETEAEPEPEAEEGAVEEPEAEAEPAEEEEGSGT